MNYVNVNSDKNFSISKNFDFTDLNEMLKEKKNYPCKVCGNIFSYLLNEFYENIYEFQT